MPPRGPQHPSTHKGIGIAIPLFMHILSVSFLRLNIVSFKTCVVIFAFCTVVREDDEFFQAMHGSCDLNPLFVRMHAMHSVRAGPRFGCSWNR